VKKLVPFVLIIVFSASTLSSTFILADYFLRYDYYSRVLCENKAEPEKKCNGKCQLAKQVEVSTSQTPIPELIQFKCEASVSESSNQALPLCIKAFIASNFNSNFSLFKSDLIFKLLRPPQNITVG
jgi:hypothetical protein